MEPTSTVTVHQLEGISERAEVRRLVSALREPGVHLLILGAAGQPADVLSLAEAVRDGAVATCVSGQIGGATLAVFAAGSLRLATPGSEISWGSTAVPGLAAVLGSADPVGAGRLAWGEVLAAEELLGGLVHLVVPDPVALVEERVTRAGGAVALGLRLRSLTAAREAGSWPVAARFDHHLVRSKAGT